MAKNDLFCLVFSVVCVVQQQKLYEKIALTERKLLIRKKCVWIVYLLISHMKSDDIFTSPNMAKSDLLCLAFSVVCFVLQQKLYEKIALTERKLLICKTCLWMLYFLI